MKLETKEFLAAGQHLEERMNESQQHKRKHRV